MQEENFLPKRSFATSSKICHILENATLRENIQPKLEMSLFPKSDESNLDKEVKRGFSHICNFSHAKLLQRKIYLHRGITKLLFKKKKSRFCYFFFILD